MATYIIGDLQGCFDSLQALLKQIHYKPKRDQLWFVGDIINRGPQSLECLRFVKKLHQKGRAQIVLGNHDFYLLAAACGIDKKQSKFDTLDDILNAKDRDELIDWLRKQPLLIQHPTESAVMVHAGIPPQWTIEQAIQYAREVEQVMQSEDWQEFISQHLFGSKTKQWHEDLSGWERLRYIVNAFTRMRYCDPDGTLDFDLKTPPEDNTHPSHQAWFVHKNRRNKDTEIYFGHWSTLGVVDAYHVHSTDTGCLWGGKLTAFCLEDQQRHTYQCPQALAPKKAKQRIKAK